MLTLRPSTLRRGLVVALLAGGIAAGSAAAGDAPEPETVAPTAAPPAPIGEVQPAQAQTLRVLRRAPRASDAVPADALVAAGPGRFGRNPELARAIPTANGTGWVVPGDETVCLVAPDPVDGYATTCSPTNVVATDGLTLTLANEESATALTLVPDGAALTVTDDDQRTRAVTPDGSGVARIDAQDADHLDVITDEGRSATPLLDADELAAGAAN